MTFLQTANDNGPPRTWRRHASSVVLGCLVPMAAFAVYRGAASSWSDLPKRSTSRPIPLKFDDSSLRQLAVVAPTPQYPQTSLANNVSGVVVANVTLEVNGQMRSVNIVESPDPATGRAVREAVSGWVFRPLGVPSRATVMTGSLIFYFQLIGGRGVVSDAKSLRAAKGVASDDKHPQAASVVKTMDEATLRAIRGSSPAVVLDTRSRAAYLRRHREGAINIPLSELAARAGAEMPRSGLIVIDCFAEQQHGPCGVAIKLLAGQGFSELAVLKRGSE